MGDHVAAETTLGATVFKFFSGEEASKKLRGERKQVKLTSLRCETTGLAKMLNRFEDHVTCFLTVDDPAHVHEGAKSFVATATCRAGVSGPGGGGGYSLM